MTKEEAVEASRLSKKFFFETFVMIPSITRTKGRLVPFKQRPYQDEVREAIDEYDRIIGLKARQIGWTTLAVANALHDALFNDWRPWLFISRNEEAAQDMVGKGTLAYYRLPPWMRQQLPKLTSDTKGAMIFDNGSRIKAEPATASTGRGDAVYGTLMDECAFMEYAEDIWAAVEAMTYGPAMLFSTANGMGNFFHDVWLDSQREGSSWKSLFYPWHVVPERDEEWYETKRLEHRVRPWFFFQEYPSSPEEAFAKSGRVAFAADVVAEAYVPMEPEQVFDWNLSEGAITLPPDEWGTGDAEIHIYVPPLVREDEQGRLLAKPNYALGVDVAEGLGHGDYSYITVFDCYNNEQVAKCKTHIPVYYLTGLVHWLAEYYHMGLLAIERNNHGIMPLEILANEYYYPRLYRMEQFATMPIGEVDRTPRYGWVTTKASKSKMVLDFQNALARGEVIIHDREFVVETQTFIADGRGSYGASPGNHDDIIMGTLIAWQAVLDSPTYHNYWVDDTIRPITFGDWEDYMFQEEKPHNPLDSFLGQEDRVEGKRKLFIS